MRLSKLLYPITFIIIILSIYLFYRRSNCSTPQHGIQVCVDGDMTTITYKGDPGQYRREYIEMAIDSLKNETAKR